MNIPTQVKTGLEWAHPPYCLANRKPFHVVLIQYLDNIFGRNYVGQTRVVHKPFPGASHHYVLILIRYSSEIERIAKPDHSASFDQINRSSTVPMIDSHVSHVGVDQ